MDKTTGRPNHIEDYLTRLYPNQWFTWKDNKNKVYAINNSNGVGATPKPSSLT